MNDLNVAMDLMKCFRGSFINYKGEFIAHQIGEAYFNLYLAMVEFAKARFVQYQAREEKKNDA